MWSSVRDAVGLLIGGNVGEMPFTVVGGLPTGSPPLNARQLLLVNLLTDAAPAMAIALRPPVSARRRSCWPRAPTGRSVGRWTRRSRCGRSPRPPAQVPRGPSPDSRGCPRELAPSAWSRWWVRSSARRSPPPVGILPCWQLDSGRGQRFPCSLPGGPVPEPRRLRDGVLSCSTIEEYTC
jgi:hypothetical protein